MRLNTRNTIWLALGMAALLAGAAVADDRDFLRQLSAAPNLVVILDTSGSMTGSPEDPTTLSLGPRYSMVPGGGDDPYSRMGIAKRVLRDFLDEVGEANVLLSAFDDQPPPSGSEIPTQRWVYEAVGVWDPALSAYRGDHFHLMERKFAYRFGYAETYSGIQIDNPWDIYQPSMIGYTPYFDPALGAAGLEDRFGPVNADEAGSGEDYDLLPTYFGSCESDWSGTYCGDGLFPFYDTGDNDSSGDMITDSWYYGDPATNRFNHCDPWKTPSWLDPDDGCLRYWEDNTGTIPGMLNYRVEIKRRIHLEIPPTNPVTGLANHFLGILDPDGTPMTGDEVQVGNQLVSDLMLEDYDLDGSWDPDYDNDNVFDWILYVDAVEQVAMRACGPPGTPTPTPTATPTPTVRPTRTPTPTPSRAKQWKRRSGWTPLANSSLPRSCSSSPSRQRNSRRVKRFGITGRPVSGS